MTARWYRAKLCAGHALLTASAGDADLRVWHGPGELAWQWEVRQGDGVDASGRMLGGSDTEPPALLLSLVETAAFAMTLAREAYRLARQPAPRALEGDPCSEV